MSPVVGRFQPLKEMVCDVESPFCRLLATLALMPFVSMQPSTPPTALSFHGARLNYKDIAVVVLFFAQSLAFGLSTCGLRNVG